MAEIVQQFYPSDDIAEDLRAVDRDFNPGEYGEVVLKLDPELAIESEKDNIIASAESMSRFLREDGLMAWPGKQPVEVDWANRTVHIYFVAQEEPSSYYTPSMAFALFPIATTVARAAPMAARAGGLAWLARLSPGAIFAWLRTSITALGKSRFGRFFFKTSTFVVGGTLIWAMVHPDSLITVLKHVAGAIGKVAEPFLTPILIGVGVMLVGAVVLTRSR
jgi:hypothetical protein